MLGALSSTVVTLSAPVATTTNYGAAASSKKASNFPTLSTRTRAGLRLQPSPLSLSIGSSSSSFKTAVAAADSDQLTPTKQQEEAKRYHFVVANAKFMLDEEEHFQEQLFERLRLYEERGLQQDFWLVIEPKFLDKFPNITKRLKRPAVALVSTNGPWITFMKLRLDRVLSESFIADSVDEALASNPATIEFDKPKNWVAPYPKYESGWWESLLPSFGLKESKV